MGRKHNSILIADAASGMALTTARGVYSSSSILGEGGE